MNEKIHYKNEISFEISIFHLFDKYQFSICLKNINFQFVRQILIFDSVRQISIFNLFDDYQYAKI